MKKKETNIIFFLRLRRLGCVMPYFRNKIVVLSRPNFNEDYYDYYSLKSAQTAPFPEQVL